ncbi:MFS transporter [Lentisphaera profundi]|uniref:MFS transporter n=1 Tax=Lentisphaera profundi TaxID=1658616 RepID=A0ABY7VZ83_9BACT|nr:MFS transporter [Lentisphaera profundi]WDE99022.1 MFS transporter [Lentisphaera profundi]
MHETLTIAENEQVPIKQKIAYGLGGLSDFFIQTMIGALAIPIFAEGMKLDSYHLGFILAGTKAVSALADPFVGIVSDKTRSKWGRRKPFILLFGILSAILMPFIWYVPDVSDNMKFLYIFVTLSTYFFFHSMFAVPYNALGYEMTSNYDEKTKIFAWKKYIGILGILAAAWFYRFTLWDIFEDEMQGAMVLGVVLGILTMFCSLAVVKGTKEIHKEEAESKVETPRIPFGEILKTTFQNKSFMLVQGAMLAIALGMGVDAIMGTYLHIHYTCGGDKILASSVGGWGGTIATVPILICVPMVIWISSHWGKRAAAICGNLVLLVGVCSIPWMMNQAYPYLIIGVWILSQFGTQSSGVMYESMISDVCDEDEFHTGERREGSYAAAGSVLNKGVQIVIFLISGYMPKLAGYVDQSVPPNMEQLLNMKKLLVATDIAGVAIALCCIFFYPLTRDRCASIKKQLQDRSAQKEAALVSMQEPESKESI